MFQKYKTSIILISLALTIAGCRMISSSPGVGRGEIILAATDDGIPVGTAVAKNIGSEGGLLVSPDGKFTLTVPPNALSETLTFSIQPISNQAAGGLGNAYQLEPRGKNFITSLEISVHYSDQDLEGTIPEALSLAFQDDQKVWHLQKAAKLDKEAKTLTVSTTHFSGWAFLSRLRLSQAKAKLPFPNRSVVNLQFAKLFL